MKILYVVGAYGRRYIANEIHRELVCEFSRRGHACLVYAGVTPGELDGEPISYQDGSIAVHRQLCLSRGRHRVASEVGRRVFQYPRFLPLLWGLQKLLAQHPDIDVIHADALYPIGAIVALAARGHRAAIVPSIHGGDVIDYPGYGYGRYRVVRRLIRWTCARSAMVRVNSPLMAARARELGCEPTKLRHVLVNVGDRFFREDAPLASRREAARALVSSQEQLDPRAPLLLSIGRLLPLKGIHDLIAAMPAVVRACPKVRLLIAGPNHIDPQSGDQYAALQREIAKSGLQEHVRLRGGLNYETELIPYLAAADLLCAVAHIEGLNRVAAEAGSQGTPSIVSTMTGVAPLITRMNAGRVVAAHAIDQLAETLIESVRSPDIVAAQGLQARRMAQYFRSAVIADELLDLYQAALHIAQSSATEE